MFRRLNRTIALFSLAAVVLAPVATSHNRLTPAERHALASNTEALGYEAITHYLVARDSGSTGIRASATYSGAGAQTEAMGFIRLTRYQVQRAMTPSLASTSTRFAWGSALIGAASMAGVLLITAAAVFAARKRTPQLRFR